MDNGRIVSLDDELSKGNSEKCDGWDGLDRWGRVELCLFARSPSGLNPFWPGKIINRFSLGNPEDGTPLLGFEAESIWDSAREKAAASRVPPRERGRLFL